MADRPAALAAQSRDIRSAIIDIGSNSVRLVVYAGPPRAPSAIFNEKLMVGLGASLATTGAIDKRAYRRGIAALTRYRALAAAMDIDSLRCVATAAVRDASNGDAFLADARAIGLDIQLLSGREEARAAGYGVISAIPGADGIVADLGGGSLELVRIRGGETTHHSSLPLGVLRLAALRATHGRNFARAVIAQMAEAAWPGPDSGRKLYLVGGSWRALARLDMLLSRDAMPVVSGHVIPLSSIRRLQRRLQEFTRAGATGIEGMTSARLATLPDAATLLMAMVRGLATQELIVSTSGLREGLLYEALPAAVQAQDPLLVAATAEGRRFARFARDGAAMDAWIAPLFTGDDAAARRLRLAACHLSDAATTANPDFKAERAVETALHGQWLGIDLADRMVLAQALHSASGGKGRAFPGVNGALGPRLSRAARWGHAIRLAQRLSGGTAGPFADSRLAIADGELQLHLAGDARALDGEQVAKRLRQLATSFDLQPRLVLA